MEHTVSALTLAKANQIIATALEQARTNGFKPMGVVVLDEAGHVKAYDRDDGATMFRFDIAVGKAWAAIGMGASSRALAERARDNPNFFVALAATASGRFLPQTGAVLIRDAGRTVVEAGTPTCVGIGPADILKIDAITGTLKLVR